MPYPRRNVNETGTKTAPRTIKASWLATVEERKSTKGTPYLYMRTQKNEVLMSWHPPTIAAILDRTNRPDFDLVIKVKDGFKRAYLPFE